jgi:uncharacterized protein (DUF2336 family)
MLKYAQQLIELAREPSSDRRRELLRRLSDLFIEVEASGSPQSREEFARTAEALLDQLDVEVRREFAERFADRPGTSAHLMARLAHDVIEVARPVLCRSEGLDDAELVAVAMMRSQDHLRAISERPEVSAAVTDVIVNRGDDDTLVSLARNLGARFSREAFERLTERSETVQPLREPLVDRSDTPLDLVHDMMVFVEEALRERIVARVRTAPPAEVAEALKVARERAESRRRVDPDEARVRREIRELKSRGRLTKPAIIEFLRGADEARFLAGLAEILGIDMALARKLWRAETLDTLAIAVRAAEVDRAFFVTIAMEREGVPTRDHARARVFGDTFEAIPIDAAKRVIRFWQVRRESNAEDAA